MPESFCIHKQIIISTSFNTKQSRRRKWNGQWPSFVQKTRLCWLCTWQTNQLLVFILFGGGQNCGSPTYIYRLMKVAVRCALIWRTRYTVLVFFIEDSCLMLLSVSHFFCVLPTAKLFGFTGNKYLYQLTSPLIKDVKVELQLFVLSRNSNC